MDKDYLNDLAEAQDEENTELAGLYDIEVATKIEEDLEKDKVAFEKEEKNVVSHYKMDCDNCDACKSREELYKSLNDEFNEFKEYINKMSLEDYHDIRYLIKDLKK